MNHPDILYMYAKSKQAETMQEIERYRLINQIKNQANPRPAHTWFKSLMLHVQSLLSCVWIAPRGQETVC
jgi:hypothetical protein